MWPPLCLKLWLECRISCSDNWSSPNICCGALLCLHQRVSPTLIHQGTMSFLWTPSPFPLCQHSVKVETLYWGNFRLYFYLLQNILGQFIQERLAWRHSIRVNMCNYFRFPKCHFTALPWKCEVGVWDRSSVQDFTKNAKLVFLDKSWVQDFRFSKCHFTPPPDPPNAKLPFLDLFGQIWS